MRVQPAIPVYLFLVASRGLCSMLVFTMLGVYYVTSAGLNPIQLVLVGTVLEATIMLAEVPTGVLADTRSRRLSVILGVALWGITYVVQAGLPLFAAILLAEVIRGLGEAFMSGATDAWIADEVGEEAVGQVYLRGSQAWQAGAIVGILGSVALAGVTLSLPILVGGVVSLATALILLIVMSERGFRPTTAERESVWQTARATAKGGLVAVRRRPLLVMLLLVSALHGAASEGYDRLWEAHLLKSFAMPGLGPLAPVAWFGVIALVSSVLGMGVVEAVRRRIDTDRPGTIGKLLVLLSGCEVAAMVMFGLSGSFALALAMLWTVSVVRQLAGPLYTTWLNRNIESRVRATVLSMSSLSNAFGQVAGGPVVGWVGTVASLRAAVVAAGLCLSPSLLLYARAAAHAREEAETA
jgi:MFS transporter, DHA3 family, tetracycline resistance protein